MELTPKNKLSKAILSLIGDSNPKEDEAQTTQNLLALICSNVLSSSLVSIKNIKEMPTAYAKFNEEKRRFEVAFDEGFLKVNSLDIIKKVIIHEVLHILYNHVHRGFFQKEIESDLISLSNKSGISIEKLKNGITVDELLAGKEGKEKEQIEEALNSLQQKMYLFNVAADIFVNQNISWDLKKDKIYIKNTPSKQILIKENKDGEKELDIKEDKSEKKEIDIFLPEKYNLVRGKSVEYYYESLKNNKKMKQEMSSGKVYAMDFHDLEELLKEGNFSEDEKLKELLAEAKKILKESGKRGGNNKSRFFNDIIEMLEETKTPWQTILKRIFKKSKRNKVRYNFKRPNRRLGLPFPELKHNYTQNILVAVDVSGSCIDDLGYFLNEIKTIANGKDFDVWFFSDKVVKEDNTKNIDFKNFKPNFGWGGTVFNSVFEKFNKEKGKWDILIMLTDGYPFEKKEDLIKVKKATLIYGILNNEKELIKFPNGVSIKIEKTED